ncbi:MAG: division/cell wall cluster transcriptional repressor MraZ [Planctomycetaceae bacterium]
MALTGTFERTIDEKWRLAIPKPLKDGFSVRDVGELYLAPGNEGCLSVYSPEGFDEFAKRVASVSPGRANVRSFLRLFYSKAERVVLDKQSRIRIPDRLITHASLQREVVILGVHDHAEIWDKSAWDTFLEQTSFHFDELTSETLENSVFEPQAEKAALQRLKG